VLPQPPARAVFWPSGRCAARCLNEVGGRDDGRQGHSRDPAMPPHMPYSGDFQSARVENEKVVPIKNMIQKLKTLISHKKNEKPRIFFKISLFSGKLFKISIMISVLTSHR
jgi:hypothetical protein